MTLGRVSSSLPPLSNRLGSAAADRLHVPTVAYNATTAPSHERPDHFQRGAHPAFGATAATTDKLPFSAPAIIGTSPKIEAVRERIRRVAPLDTTVLITGETGTGKEVVARQIHAQSARVENPFMAVNCAALPETLAESLLFGHAKGAFTGADKAVPGFFEAAENGTLFLDEVEALAPSVQAKLLRALQYKEFSPVGSTKTQRANVRILAAANTDLAVRARDKQHPFREDLYHRLNRFHIHLPPLRDRKEDIPLLVPQLLEERYLAREIPQQRFTVTPEGFQFLQDNIPEGNIRGLEGVLVRAAIMSDTPELGPEQLKLGMDVPQDSPNGHAEPVHIDDALATPTMDYTDFDAIRAVTLQSLIGHRTWKTASLAFRRIYYAYLYHTCAQITDMEKVSGQTRNTIEHQLRQIHLPVKQDPGKTVHKTHYSTLINNTTHPNEVATSIPTYEFTELPYEEAERLFAACFIRHHAPACEHRSQFTRQHGNPTNLDEIMTLYRLQFNKPAQA